MKFVPWPWVFSLPAFALRHTLFVQGGLTLVRVLTLLKQVIAALLHLHSLGIVHRDLRAANILIDALDPLRVLLADFGVSHLLSAFASGEVYRGASKMTSVLTGAAALGPLQVGGVLDATTRGRLVYRDYPLLSPPLF